MSDSTEDIKLKRTKGEVANTITKAVLSAIPYAGGPLAELLTLVWEPAAKKRRDAWLVGIAENLKSLEDKVEGFKIENLVENELFVTATMEATRAAISTHQQEKLDALRNIVLNTAIGTDLDEDFQLILIALVERMTASQLKVLQIIASGERGISINKLIEERISTPGAVTEAIADRIKGLNPNEGNAASLIVVIEDLSRQDLIRLSSEPSSHYDEAFMYMNEHRAEVTALGYQLLGFISEPGALKEAK